MSPMAPAGSATRKNGRVEAVWVNATYRGPAPSETMSQAAPTPCMDVPTSDAMSAIRSQRKIGVRSGRHGLGRSGFDAIALPAFQLLAIPSSQRRRGLVPALQKVQHDAARVGRLPHLVVRQQEVGELCAVEGRRGADRSLLEARWFGRGVGVERRAGEAAAAEPEAATAHLVRVPLARNRLDPLALRPPPAGKARDGEIEAAPEKGHRTRLADEAPPELLADLVRGEQRAPGPSD